MRRGREGDTINIIRFLKTANRAQFARARSTIELFEKRHVKKHPSSDMRGGVARSSYGGELENAQLAAWLTARGVLFAKPLRTYEGHKKIPFARIGWSGAWNRSRNRLCLCRLASAEVRSRPRHKYFLRCQIRSVDAQ